jgi:hypothetical protein
VSIATVVDRRKSYVDVMERVLGTSHIAAVPSWTPRVIGFDFSNKQRDSTVRRARITPPENDKGPSRRKR